PLPVGERLHVGQGGVGQAAGGAAEELVDGGGGRLPVGIGGGRLGRGGGGDEQRQAERGEDAHGMTPAGGRATTVAAPRRPGNGPVGGDVRRGRGAAAAAGRRRRPRRR